MLFPSRPRRWQPLNMSTQLSGLQLCCALLIKNYKWGTLNTSTFSIWGGILFACQSGCPWIEKASCKQSSVGMCFFTLMREAEFVYIFGIYKQLVSANFHQNVWLNFKKKSPYGLLHIHLLHFLLSHWLDLTLETIIYLSKMWRDAVTKSLSIFVMRFYISCPFNFSRLEHSMLESSERLSGCLTQSRRHSEL